MKRCHQTCKTRCAYSFRSNLEFLFQTVIWYIFVGFSFLVSPVCLVVSLRVLCAHADEKRDGEGGHGCENGDEDKESKHGDEDYADKRGQALAMLFADLNGNGRRETSVADGRALRFRMSTIVFYMAFVNLACALRGELNSDFTSTGTNLLVII